MAASVRVEVAPEVLEWALTRADMTVTDLSEADQSSFLAWLQGERKPTFRQLSSFAKRVRVPAAFLLLKEPPAPEPDPIADFRTLGSGVPKRFSFNLRTVIEDATYQQSWYEEELLADGVEELDFVGSIDESTSPVLAGQLIRRELRLDADPIEAANWAGFRKELVSRIEDLGVVVQVSGIAGSTKHALNVDEFRGFCLVSKIAPFIFVNAKDAEPARVFTLVHELAHVWAGRTGVSDPSQSLIVENEHEVWANRVAANVLLPKDEFVDCWNADITIEQIRDFACKHGVSGEVVIRRAKELGKISFVRQNDLIDKWYAQYQGQAGSKLTGRGGDFYRTAQMRLGKPLIQQVIRSTKAGNLSYRNALKMLGINKLQTFDRLAEKVGV